MHTFEGQIKCMVSECAFPAVLLNRVQEVTFTGFAIYHWQDDKSQTVIREKNA